MILSYLFLSLFFIVFIAVFFYLTFYLKIRLPNYVHDLSIDTKTIGKSQLKPLEKKLIQEEKKAYVFCSSEKTFSHKSETQYLGFRDCTIFKAFHESELSCSWSCIGFGTCIPHCPQNAIVLKNNTALITDACDGCGICIDVCPNNVIKLIPKNDDYIIPCASHDGDNTTCSKACTACKLCTDPSLHTGFVVKDNLAESDYISNTLKSSYAAKCPQKCIVKTNFPRKNDFQFLKIWDRIRNKMIKESSDN